MMELNELSIPIKDLATTTAMTAPTSLPPAPSPTFSSLPTEIIAMIAKELLLDAKGPETPSKNETSIRWKKERKAMGEAITGLASLARTSRRLNKIVTPTIYEHPFLLQQNRFDNGSHIENLYGLVRLLGEDDELADMVRCYQAPRAAISDTLGAFLNRCYREPQSYQKVLILLNKYIPFLAKLVAGLGDLDTLTNGYLEAPGVMAGLIPAVILCHCRNIKQLDHLSIGGNRGGNCWRFLWRDLVAAAGSSSVTFPNLQSAKLEGKSFTELHLLPITTMAALRQKLTDVDEAVAFVNLAAPSLRHLTLKSFASSCDDGPSTVPDQVPIRTLERLTSLEMHYCAFLKEADLCRIIKACPRLERFVFTSEASPRVGRIFMGLKSAFIGPKMILKALAPVSQQLKALSIKYAGLVDLCYMKLVLDDDDTDTDMEDDDDTDTIDDGTDMADDTDTGYDDELDVDLDIDDDDDDDDEPMDPNENLIKTLSHFQQFPNLKLLRISHSALYEWPPFPDGRPNPEEKDQLVNLIKGCPNLESLDITQYDIENSPIRPQLERLIAAVTPTTSTTHTSTSPTTTHLSQFSQLKTIRISLDTSARRLEADWITDNSDNPYLKDLFAREHLTKYIQRGIMLRIDVAPLKEYEVLEPFPGPVSGFVTRGNHGHEQKRGGVSFAPCLERFLPPPPPVAPTRVARKRNKKGGKKGVKGGKVVKGVEVEKGKGSGKK